MSITSETSAPKEHQIEKLVLTKSKFAALEALQDVYQSIFGLMFSGILLDKIPKDPQKNKNQSPSFYENEKILVAQHRAHAKKVLGLILGKAALELSDEKINELIERYNSAQLRKRDKCIQYILQGNTDALLRELETLYQQFQERRGSDYQKSKPRWSIEEIVTAASIDFDPTNNLIHNQLRSSLEDPVTHLAAQTPSLQQNLIQLSTVDKPGNYFVPELGQFVQVFPDSQEIEINSVRLPHDIGLEGVRGDLMFGIESRKHVDQDRIEIFRRIAEQKRTILTHITWNNHRLLQIIQSKHFGLPGNPNRTFVEIFNFSEQSGEDITKYLFEDRDWSDADYIHNKIFKNLKSSDIEADKYSNIGSSYTKDLPRYLPAAYIHNGSTEPIFIFDAMKMKGILYPERFFALKRIPLSHEGLQYILVTPHFRKILLEWIGTWTDAQRREIFGDKDVEKVFISNAEEIV